MNVDIVNSDDNKSQNKVSIISSTNKDKLIKPKKKKFLGNIEKTSPIVADIMTGINNMIIGQEEAKKQLSYALTNCLAHDPYDKTPLAVFFFPGPTGVGKTEIVRSLAKILYGDEFFDLGLCKFDCNNFAEPHLVSQLHGAPDGYIGYGKKPLLHPDFMFKHTTDAIKENRLHSLFKKIVERDSENLPSLILLDEFEKADEKFRTFFMNIFDNGTVTLKQGTQVNFRNTIFIMTSNVGADEIKMSLEGKGVIGLIKSDTSAKKLFSLEYYKDIIEKSGLFKKEILGRLNIVPFRPLTSDEFHQRLLLQITNHNKAFSYTTVRLKLTKRVKAYLVDASMKSNEGARHLVNMFKLKIRSIYTRLCFNGEIDRVEIESGQQVKYIEIDFINDVFQGSFLINEDVKALNKEKKDKILLEARKKHLNQQEVIVSLKDESMLITQRDIMLPNLKYYVALLTHRDDLDENFKEEMKTVEKILYTFGYQEKDFELLKYQILEDKYNAYEESYNELHLQGASIKLWDDDDKQYTFDGMLRYVEKYMRKYFETNKDVKAMIKGGAGSTKDIIQPITEYATILINRELNNKEMSIILMVLHREYSKLNAIIPVEKQIVYKASNESKVKKIVAKPSNTNIKPITININFGTDVSVISTKLRLKNLFQEKFPEVILAITQNISNKKDSDDIIDIMNNIKIELEQKFDIGSAEGTSIMQLVQEILKEEELLKK